MQRCLHPQNYHVRQINDTLIFFYRMKGEFMSPVIQKTGLTILAQKRICQKQWSKTHSLKWSWVWKDRSIEFSTETLCAIVPSHEQVGSEQTSSSEPRFRQYLGLWTSHSRDIISFMTLSTLLWHCLHLNFLKFQQHNLKPVPDGRWTDLL